MAQTKHVLKFSAIVEFFAEAEERKLISKAENAVVSNHIKSFRFDASIGLLKGEVYASMRDRSYNVEVNLDEDGQIKDCTCSCPRGLFLCHHVAALCIYGHHNISVTDVECKWSQRKAKEEPVKTVEELYVGKTHKSTTRKATDAEIDGFLTTLKAFGNTVGFTWLLNKEPSTTICTIVPDVEEVLFSEEYLTAADKRTHLLNSLQLSETTIQHVKEATVGQWKNENWLVCRKHRLTASNFGVVLAAIARNRFPPSLFKRLSGAYNLEHVKAVQWGNVNESVAIKQFTETTNLEVTPTGLWLHECGYIGASPDGLINDEAILEVKCPYKYRDKLLSEALTTDKTYIVHITENGDHVLNKAHEYYHQIQGNLALTGRQLCYLVIWTLQEQLIVPIQKDLEWETVQLHELRNFYTENYIPYLLENVIFD